MSIDSVPEPGETFPHGIIVQRVNEATIHYTRHGSANEFEVHIGLWDVISAERVTQRQWPSVQQAKASRTDMNAPPIGHKVTKRAILSAVR